MGYCELEMFDDALLELSSLPPSIQSKPEILHARLQIQMRGRYWNDALSTALELCHAEPDSGVAFLHAAFCLHEMGRTGDARITLLKGPKALQGDPTFHYNLACYDAVLGNLDDARSHLDVCIRIDSKFASIAKHDPDLAPLELV